MVRGMRCFEMDDYLLLEYAHRLNGFLRCPGDDTGDALSISALK